jgi:hypothetical protein
MGILNRRLDNSGKQLWAALIKQSQEARAYCSANWTVNNRYARENKHVIKLTGNAISYEFNNDTLVTNQNGAPYNNQHSKCIFQ